MAKKDFNNNRFNIVDLDLGKLPPQAVDLEEAVLGALMLDREAIDIVMPILAPEYFYKDVHQKIYSAIVKLDAESNPIDILTVTEQLRKDDCLDEVGGPFYVTMLTNKIASSAHIEFHSRMIAEKYFLREMIRISSEMSRISFESDAEIEKLIDFTSQQFDSLTTKVFGKKAGNDLSSLLRRSINEYYQRSILRQSGLVSGIKTPVRKLTEFTAGWQKGDLIIIAGRPSMGKTAVVLATLKEAAKNGEFPAVFSLEMSGVRLVDRLLCGEANISAERFRNGELFPDEAHKMEEAAGRLIDLGIYIDDNPGVSMEYIKNKARTLKRKGQCSMIVVDYLQLVEGSKEKGKTREQEVSEISRKAKLIAKELDVPFILLAQLNRSCELRGGDKRPNISDLRESGAIEQDADVIILLYRPEYYGFLQDADGNSTKGMGEFIIGKQRNGKVGPVFFGYNESLTRIFDYGATEENPFTNNNFEKDTYSPGNIDNTNAF